jgi:hypothetical protein
MYHLIWSTSFSSASLRDNERKIAGMCLHFVTGTLQSALVLQTQADNWADSNGNAKKHIFFSEDLTVVSKHNTKIIQVHYSAHVSKRPFLLNS